MVSVSGSQVSSSAAESLPAQDDDDDEELEQLLSLQKAVAGVSGNESVDDTDEKGELVFLPHLKEQCNIL